MVQFRRVPQKIFCDAIAFFCDSNTFVAKINDNIGLFFSDTIAKKAIASRLEHF